MGTPYQYPDEVVSAIVSSYYGRHGSAPDSARTRAQTAAGLAGAGAAGVFGGIVVAGLAGKVTWIQALGLAALLAWTACTALYVFAVAVPVELTVTSKPRTQTEFVDEVIRLGKQEREAIDRRQLRANVAAGVAIVITLATFASIGLYHPDELVKAQVFLTAPSSLCPSVGAVLSGRVERSTINDELVRVLPDAAACNAHEIFLPRAAISGIELRSS